MWLNVLSAVRDDARAGLCALGTSTCLGVPSKVPVLCVGP